MAITVRQNGCHIFPQWNSCYKCLQHLTLFLSQPYLPVITRKYLKKSESEYNIFSQIHINAYGPDCSVGLVTSYRLDSMGIESQWWRDFPHPASYTMGIRSFPGVKRLGRSVDHPSLSSTEVYSPMGLPGLL
jgi:hypothetical protein